MAITELNMGLGGIWTVDSNDNVTLTPTTNSDGWVVRLDILIDYNISLFAESNGHPGVTGMTFIGPVNDPNGIPINQTFYDGLAVPTTITVKNNLPAAIYDYQFYLTNRSLNSPDDFASPHPNDYAHFHNLTQASLVDANGTPNAIVLPWTPDHQTGAFGSPGSQLPTPAANQVEGIGRIEAGATERLVGAGSNGTFTLHSENAPGPQGGSFSLGFLSLGMEPFPPPIPFIPDDLTIRPELTRGDDLPPLLPTSAPVSIQFATADMAVKLPFDF